MGEGVNAAVFEFCLRQGDSALILGQRLSEWCGHGPVLEQDIALTNVALDMIGQARAWLTYAGEVEGKGRDEDALAFHRDALDFRNLLLTEHENVDFAYTMARQFYFSTFLHLFQDELQGSRDERIAAIAAKAVKETTYHRRLSSEWVIRLGDGTQESHAYMQAAVDDLWRFTGEFFEADEVEETLIAAGVAADPRRLRAPWEAVVASVFDEATLRRPEPEAPQRSGGRSGYHSERLGHILSQMQFLQRAYPGAQW